MGNLETDMHTQRTPCVLGAVLLWEASRSQRKPAVDPAPAPAGGAWPCQHLDFRLLASRAIRWHRSVVQATQFVVFRDYSPSKPIQSPRSTRQVTTEILSHPFRSVSLPWLGVYPALSGSSPSLPLACLNGALPHAPDLGLLLLFYYICLFIWLCWVLVAACKLFRIKPGHSALGALDHLALGALGALSHWTTRDIPRPSLFTSHNLLSGFASSLELLFRQWCVKQCFTAGSLRGEETDLCFFMISVV